MRLHGGPHRVVRTRFGSALSLIAADADGCALPLLHLGGQVAKKVGFVHLAATADDEAAGGGGATWVFELGARG
jgi:hypothetical protein